jgi:CheY-like chemotaxis protein
MNSPIILVTEDEPLIALDLQNRLRRMGYTVPPVATSGEQAIELARKARPDLLLMDVSLGGDMDGIEAATQILRFIDAPVIFLTANTDTDSLQRAQSAPAAGYLLKPLREPELRVTIAIALARHARQRDLQARASQAAEARDEARRSLVETAARLRQGVFLPIVEAARALRAQSLDPDCARLVDLILESADHGLRAVTEAQESQTPPPEGECKGEGSDRDPET